ncbi:MAG: glutamyl-tRNA reductase, partial [Pseudomonadota bacterium]|nr:glutamyl-tRNA reductase [Pseudomonadota bacterium]
MQLLALGLNHTTAPLALREKVAFPADQIGHAVAAARAWFGKGGNEAAILSTCNRTELYTASNSPAATAAALDATAQFLSNYHQLSAADLRPYLYALPQDDA